MSAGIPEGFEPVDAEELAKELTGFEEIAVRKAFGTPIGQCVDTMVPRAVLFVALKRHGMRDAEAFNVAMNIPLGKLEDYIKAGEYVEGKAGATSTPSDMQTS